MVLKRKNIWARSLIRFLLNHGHIAWHCNHVSFAASWGHSLGAAVGTIAMCSLQAAGYDVGLSYLFESPRVLVCFKNHLSWLIVCLLTRGGLNHFCSKAKEWGISHSAKPLTKNSPDVSPCIASPIPVIQFLIFHRDIWRDSGRSKIALRRFTWVKS